MKVKLIFKNAGNTTCSVIYDLSLMQEIPQVGDEVIDVESGIVQYRTFDYTNNIVIINIKV